MLDGKLAACDRKEVRVWDTMSGTCTPLSGHTDWVHAVTVLRDGKLATGSADKTVLVWDPTSERCLMTLSEDFGVSALLALASVKLAVLSRKTLIIYQ